MTDETLKELKQHFPASKKWKGMSDTVINYFELKQLAIKWVKEDLDSLIGIFPPLRKDKLLDIKKWMERFNITEEDLK